MLICTVQPMDTVRAFEVGRKVRASGVGVDSSVLRGSATKQAQAQGAVAVGKYNEQVSVLASVELFDSLLDGVEETVRMRRDMSLLAPLLSAALKLGIAPDQALAAVFGDVDHVGPNIRALAALVDDASDDLEAAAIARARLAEPQALDIGVDELADQLGIDISAVRADVEAAQPRATIG